MQNTDEPRGDLDDEQLLLPLFRFLVRSGVPLGTRDYLDGLRALQGGFGTGSLDRLRKMVLAVWARTAEEHRIVERWFAALPTASSQLVRAFDERLAENEASLPLVSSWDGPAHEKDEENPETSQAFDHSLSASESGPRSRISIAGPRERGGIPLPRIAAHPAIGESYVMRPRPLVPVREMAMIWRRFRRTSRTGIATEVDLVETIAERCRKGSLLEPKRRPRRRNTARLAMLVDLSDSMSPWTCSVASLAESVALAGLATAEVRFFRNLLGRRVHESPWTTSSEEWETFAVRNAGSALMIISDAGSARGLLNRRRANQTVNVLERDRARFSAVVWINPMPRDRWPGTTAGLVTQVASVPMFCLNRSELLLAIDVMRGNK